MRTLVLACIAACASAPHPKVIAELERGPCNGDCPSYDVSVYDDGRVEYIGTSFVRVRGDVTAQLSPHQLAELIAAFATADYFQLPAELTCGYDAPEIQTFFARGARSRSIRHQPTCDRREGMTAGAKLTDLEHAFDRIVGTARWVKP